MAIERGEGVIFNEKKIARIKKKYQLETIIRRRNKYRIFAKKKQEHDTFPNILSRNFRQERPDKVYSTDITQINYGHKKAYVAAVKDLCTNEIVSKSVSNRIDIKLTNSAIDKALKKLTKEKREGLMIHSDQGFHFTHISYRLKLKNNGVTQSMSRKGNCIDNAPIESFFGHLKDLLELKECKNIIDIEKEVTKKINYYNHRRPQLGLKKMPPSEYRRLFDS
jgi:transposase InsO family protein